ncbi:hypothetical protein QE393_003250 [Pseudomonas sp. SORGH_AS 211]|nr:hypothetical protein [Pseudomonas sp. SORGH_AS_0211]
MGQLLADRGQHGGIGQVEDRSQQRQQLQLAIGQQRLPGRYRLGIAGADFVAKALGQVIVDLVLGHPDDGDDGGRRQQRHQPEHHGGAEEIGQATGQRRRDGVAGVVEAFVAADVPGEGLGPDDAQGDGRQRRGEEGRRGMGQRLGGRHHIEVGDEGQQHAADGHHQGGDADHEALVAGAVDQGAGGRLGDQPGDAGQGHDETGGGLVPALPRTAHGDQVDGEIGAQAVADVGQGEVQGIQGMARAARGFGAGPGGRGTGFGHERASVARYRSRDAGPTAPLAPARQ